MPPNAQQYPKPAKPHCLRYSCCAKSAVQVMLAALITIWSTDLGILLLLYSVAVAINCKSCNPSSRRAEIPSVAVRLKLVCADRPLRMIEISIALTLPADEEINYFNFKIVWIFPYPYR